MKRLTTGWRSFLCLVAAVQLSACSRTVQWEEEVPLNTGETIWVKRTVIYSLRGGAGNPLDTSYRREKDEAIEFKWNGKNYYYKGEAVIMVLAISPKKVPVLVAQAEANAWNWRYKYACTYPFYVQLVANETGNNWTWPPHIEPWLYNLPTNLLRDFGTPQTMPSRYTVEQKRLQPYLRDSQSIPMQKIDPNFSGDLCKRKEK